MLHYSLKKLICCIYPLLFLFPENTIAQSLEPRLYSNAPVGMNFLIAGYVYSEGAPSINPEAGLDDPNIVIHSPFLAYARFFELLGHSAKVDLVLPAVSLDGHALFDGETVTRKITGAGDVKARISWNIVGAPALGKKAFAAYRQNTIVGISLQLTAPTGQYDGTKLVNISANRWAFKPSIGVSKALGDFIAELSAQAEFYTDNHDFYGGGTRTQDPIYSMQTHLIYTIRPGMWGAFDATYYQGGETATNGIHNDDAFDNSRLGLTFAAPLSRTQSLKFNYSNGVITRAGSNFDMYTLAWQYRWGGKP